jgi:hypothetical protein
LNFEFSQKKWWGSLGVMGDEITVRFKFEAEIDDLI